MTRSRSGLKALFLHAVTAVALLGGGPAGAQSGTAGWAATAASPFLGQWELDLARMPADYGMPPKRVVFTFADIGSDKWLTTVDITAPDDKVRHAAVRYRRDGRAVPTEGDRIEADSAAFSNSAPNVLVLSMGQDKRLAGVRTYVISPDGTEMTESAANVDRSGAPFVRTFHFKRIR